MQMYQVDAFTDKVFGGNPAAIVPLDKWIDDDLMQKIAMENNLSETAFIGFDKTGIRIRWFTPTTEVDLCGHATLAAAKVWFDKMEPRAKEVVFNSHSGELTVTRDGELLVMDFPNVKPTVVTDAKKQAAVAEAIGVDVLELLENDDLNAVIADEATLQNLKPDLAKVAALIGYRGLSVTAKSSADIDYVSRSFFPQSGIDEDPVTGSAHCGLAPYWAEKLGKTKLSAKQISARGGDLQCEVTDQRVKLSGHAVLFMTARINL